MTQKGFALIAFILVIFVVAGLIIGGAFFIKKNYPSLLQKASQTLPSNKALNLNLSLLFSITKGRLQDHNYDTYTVTSAQTYKSDIILKDKSPANIGYTGGKNSYYQYQTSASGKYLIRSTNNRVEIASTTDPATFTKIFDLPDGKVSWFLFSKDESKIVIQYDQAGPKIAIQSFTNPKDKVVVVPQRTSDTYFVFGYDNQQNQLYWQRSEGPMIHYTELVSLESNGKITQVKDIKDFSFITEFDSNFQYAYYEGYGSRSEGYKRSVIQQDLKTGKKNNLAEFPNDTSIVNMKLSPTEDKLFFIDNAATKATNTLYMINLQTKKLESFLVNPGLNPEKTNYVSPDGKYLIFQITISCSNDDCNSEHEGEAILFDVEKRQFYKLYTPVGIKESVQDDSNNYHDIENFGFIGWLAIPGVPSLQVETLPKVTF